MLTRPVQTLNRNFFTDDGWELFKHDGQLISYTREIMDHNLPLVRGDYRLYFEAKYPRIRITKQHGTYFDSLYVGICVNEGMYRQILDLIEFQKYCK
jgi:hypothetical protein